MLIRYSRSFCYGKEYLYKSFTISLLFHTRAASGSCWPVGRVRRIDKMKGSGREEFIQGVRFNTRLELCMKPVKQMPPMATLDFTPSFPDGERALPLRCNGRALPPGRHRPAWPADYKHTMAVALIS